MMDSVFEIKECRFKDEDYLAREDGFIFRKSKAGSRKRKLDEQWTPGMPDAATGYCKFGTVRVHVIVATAFHGERDTKKFVVMHIDGNRKNNAPSNLKWVTRLQAAFDNPDNIQKLLVYFPDGLQEYLNNPVLLKLKGCTSYDISWMADISPEEAQATYAASIHAGQFLTIDRHPGKTDVNNRVETWKPFEEGENIAEFLQFSKREKKLHTPKEEYFTFMPEEMDWKFFMTVSPTPLVLQENWNTPTLFPCCPAVADENTLAIYHDALAVSGLFCKNDLWQSYVLDKALAEDKTRLWVLTENSSRLKKWALTEIYLKEGFIIHSTVSTFFTKEGAEKQFTLIQGKEWTGGDSIDDYC